MIADPYVRSEIAHLVHAIQVTRQNGDTEGAASLAWELADTLVDSGLL